MPRLLQLVFIVIAVLAVLAVAVADVFLKKAADGGSWAHALKSPWLLGAVLLINFD